MRKSESFKIITITLLVLILALVLLFTFNPPAEFRTVTITYTETLTVTSTNVSTVTKTMTETIFITISLILERMRHLRVHEIYFIREDKPDNKFDLDLYILVENIATRAVLIHSIIIPDADTTLYVGARIQPLSNYSGYFRLLIDKPYVERGVNWSYVWRIGSEHVVVISYYLENILLTYRVEEIAIVEHSKRNT